MAAGEDSTEPEDNSPTTTRHDASPLPVRTAAHGDPDRDTPRDKDDDSGDGSGEKDQQHEAGDDSDEGDEEEEEEEEPRLKYATLTKNVASLYRNGDGTSACLVAGDKMIVGTLDGYVHVFLMPSLHTLKFNKVHKADVTAISMSPYPPPLPTGRVDSSNAPPNPPLDNSEKSPSASPVGKKQSRAAPIPRTQSNDIFVATSSRDGNVCIFSLIDPDDVQLRNFGRPLQAVALSPEFKSDRTYLSGGQAGSLVLTVGGPKGKPTNANVTGTAAAATSWLGSMGLGANNGTDRVLHSGEGTISVIKWSLTGKYVVWVNESGIKFMHSHLQLPSTEHGLEWKRFGHIDRPGKAGSTWEEMASVWKARAEWVDRNSLETEGTANTEVSIPEIGDADKIPRKTSSSNIEEVLIGWGNTVWLCKVIAGKKEKDPATIKVDHRIVFDDCTISGISMYTEKLILVLAHMEKKPSKRSKKTTDTIKKGRPQRRNGLPPELRIVDITTKEEVDANELPVSRYETLSSSDYHLSVLGATRSLAQLAQKGYLEAIGSGMSAVGSGLYSGVETVGQGMYDATMYGPRRLGVNRLFSSGDSIRSGRVGHDGSSSVKGGNYLTGWIPGLGSSTIVNEDVAAVATTQGMKIFVFSPYDCIVGIKRNLSDRLQWLLKEKKYQQAWELLDEHPETAGASNTGAESPGLASPSRPSSFSRADSMTSHKVPPTQGNTLAEFFTDSVSISSSPQREANKSSKAEHEKRRIGELWVHQLVDAQRWSDAGEVAGKALDTTSQWEHWVWKFIQRHKFDEISPYIPTFQITPPLASSVFEIVLGHYVSTDRTRFKELLDQWPSDLFEIKSITSAIEDQLGSGTAVEGSDDWQSLQECLAKLCLADGNYKEALRCYVRVQDADTALTLIKEHHLVDAIRDDIASFVLLRIPRSELKRAPNQELDELSSDPIKLLVDEATHGVVEVEDVVSQLQAASLNLFLFFYFRALWRGEGLQHSLQPKTKFRGRGATAAATLATDEGRLLVEQYADTAVELFAEYDRSLFMEFLHTSTRYDFDTAMKICERRHYVEELVYLLSKTGAMKKALFLIIDELKDVSKAIAFAKEQDDRMLWNDFLEYSMSRPQFISGLLAEVGTAIDPIELVKRIPSGLEIEGLKDGLQKMLREYDIQDSISSGVAKVLSSEVAGGMNTLRRGRRKGIKFEVPPVKKHKPHNSDAVAMEVEEEILVPQISSGHCAGCEKAFTLEEKETLVGFACGHVYHVSHLLREPGRENERELPLPKLRKDDGNDEDEEETYTSGFTRSVGPKVTNARLLKDKIEEIGGCQACQRRREQIPQV